MKKIAQADVEEIPFPTNLTLDSQRGIVGKQQQLQSKLDDLIRLQAETAAELDSLLPSILDKAFREEL